MTSPFVGFTITREANEPAPPSYAKMSVIGLCGPFTVAAPYDQTTFDATFPLNTPVLINTTDAKARLIDPDSVIGQALSLINAQSGNGQTAALAIIVRVAAGVSDDATIANIVGNAASFTGINAFRRAGAVCGVFPRLIACPGYTHQTKNGVTGSTITAQGSGGANGTFSLAFTGGTGSGAAGTFTVAGGKLTAIEITSGGSYTVAPTPSFAASSGLSGATATLSIGMLANPVAAALPAVLSSILAIAYVYDGGIDADTSKDYRSTLSSDRLQPIGVGVKVINSTGSIVNADPAPVALGLHVRRDFQFDGRPFRSIMNQPVYGVVGTTRDIEFHLLDGSAEGQDLLSNQIGVIVRGETGNDFAIGNGGFVFMGFENVGQDAVWQQTHKVRGRDFIELTTIRTVRDYLGRFNLTTQTIQSVINVVDNILGLAEGQQEIFGRRVTFDTVNNSSDLRTGKFYVSAQFEEVPVFRKMVLLSRPYEAAIQMRLDELLAAQSMT